MQTKTINISLPRDVLENVDRKAKEEYRSRSELLKDAAIVYIQTKDNWAVLQNNISEKAKKLRIQNDAQIENAIDSLRN